MSQDRTLFQTLQDMIAEALVQGKDWSDLKEDSKFKSLVSQLQAVMGDDMSQEGGYEKIKQDVDIDRNMKAVADLVEFFRSRNINPYLAGKLSACAVSLLLGSSSFMAELNIKEA